MSINKIRREDLAEPAQDLRSYVEALHTAAAGITGKLVLAAYGENPDTARKLSPTVAHFAPGDVQSMVEQAEKWNTEPHRNVYAGWSVMRAELPPGRKGSEHDVLAVLALVCDFDAKNDPRAGDYLQRLPLPPDCVIETSPGSFQAVYLLSEPAAPADAKPVAVMLAERAGCDPVSKDMCHVWRPAGTLNYPSRDKLAAGRSREPFKTRFAKPWAGSRTKLEDLAAALSASPAASNVVSLAAIAPAKQATDSAPVEIPQELRAQIERGPAPGEDRSKTAFGVIKALQDAGHNEQQAAMIIAAHPEGIGQRYAGKPDRLARDVARVFGKVPAWVGEMNERFFVVNEAGRVMVYRPTIDHVLRRAALERITFEDMRKLFLNERVAVGNSTDKATGESRTVYKNKADAWLSHPQRREYRGGVVFAPGKNLPADTLNLWAGFAVTPAPGDWRLMRAHIRDVICAGDESLDRYVMGWLARAVQIPGEQGEVALVLRGGKGTGKGTLGHALTKIFGQHALYITNGKHLTGQFNAHLRDAVFVFADEAFFAGDRAHEGVLKGLVTDPLLTIEGKYQTAITARNVTHVFMASNENWVVPASADERRFCVLDVSDKHRQDRAYFRALHAEMEAGGLGAMLRDLLAYDLEGFEVRDVPSTAALAEQKTLSLSGADAWLYDSLQRGSVALAEWTEEGLRIDKGTAYDNYRQRHKDFRSYAPQDIRAWAKTVRKALAACVTEQRRRAGREECRPREFVFDGLDACRDAFADYLGAAIEWENETAEKPDKSRRHDEMFD